MAEKPIRLVKLISHAGFCSRREAEKLIDNGEVFFDGKPYKNFIIDTKLIDRITVKGERLRKQNTRVWCFNKRIGLVCSNTSQYNKKTIFDVFPKDLPRVVSVGRLDINSEGLLLLTNDEILRKKLNQSPSIAMVYHVVLDKNVTPEMIKQLKKGQIIFNKQAKINAISHLDGKSKNEIGIELHSLSPAALVKLFDSIGLKVIQMDRVTFGGLTKKDLPRGNWRKLSIKEIGFLKMLP